MFMLLLPLTCLGSASGNLTFYESVVQYMYAVDSIFVVKLPVASIVKSSNSD